MTEPIDQATKDLIEKEARVFASRWAPIDPRRADAFDSYIAGATVWAEKLKQERNKAIDECIEIVSNSNYWDACGQKLRKLKDKSHEAKTKDSQKPY